MKKIVSAVALAAVAASLATAEIKTSLNFRMGTNVFNNANTSGATVSYMKLGDVAGTDAFTFKANNDYAGITLNYNPKAAIQYVDKDNTSGKRLWAAGNGVEYTAYVQPTTWLTLKGGVHKDGISWAELAKKDTDDTSWSAAGRYAFLYKLGVATKNSTAFSMDILTAVNGADSAFFLADFIFNNVGPGNLLIRATAAETLGTATVGTQTSGWLLGNYNKKTVSVAPGVMVAYTMKDVIKFNADFQMATNNDIAAGLYVQPLGLLDDNLTALVGFTLSTNLSDTTDKRGYSSDIAFGETFYAVDLRLRYVAGDFHIANAFNFTGATADGLVKQGGSTASARTGNSNIWDAIFLTFKVNDNWTITGNIQPQISIGDDTIIDLAVTPGVMYTVGKGATITAGLYTTFNDLSDKTAKGRSIGVALPVIFRVKM